MKRILIITLVMCFGIHYSFSQGDCGCDHFVSMNEFGFNAEDVNPGEVICIEAGTRLGFKLRNVVGTSTQPIIIKNCGGDVLIGDGPFSFGFNIGQSKHFRLTGTGEGEEMFGIKITESNISGLNIYQKSSDFVVDHIELTNIVGNPAIRIGDDPKCSLVVNEGVFTMQNCDFHDIRITDCSEGILIGNPLFRIGVENPYCGILYPHSVSNILVKDCEFININAGDAIQCYGTSGKIRNNVLRDVEGTAMRFGTECEIEVESNQIIGTIGHGIYTKGCGAYDFSNNVFLNNGIDEVDAVYIDFDLPLGYFAVRQLNVRHNTIINSGGFNIKIDEAFLANESSFVENNIFCEPNPLMSW